MPFPKNQFTQKHISKKILYITCASKTLATSTQDQQALRNKDRHTQKDLPFFSLKD